MKNVRRVLIENNGYRYIKEKIKVYTFTIYEKGIEYFLRGPAALWASENRITESTYKPMMVLAVSVQHGENN